MPDHPGVWASIGLRSLGELVGIVALLVGAYTRPACFVTSDWSKSRALGESLHPIGWESPWVTVSLVQRDMAVRVTGQPGAQQGWCWFTRVMPGDVGTFRFPTFLWGGYGQQDMVQVEKCFIQSGL